MEWLREGAVQPRHRVRPVASLDTLLHRNRSTRGFDYSHPVSEEQLREIVAVNTLVASSGNRQLLRFKIVTDASAVLPHIRMGAALPQEHLPKPGMAPQAFIAVCSTVAEDRLVDIDLGISLQSMGLKAAQMGLNVLIICALDGQALRSSLGLPSEPLALLAVGKGAESIYLKPVSAGESLSYYRKDGVHYVPKLRLEDILL